MICRLAKTRCTELVQQDPEEACSGKRSAFPGIMYLPRRKNRPEADDENPPEAKRDKPFPAAKTVDTPCVKSDNTRLVSAEGYPSGQRGQTVNLLAMPS